MSTTEAEVGITEYATAGCLGFTGILKHRFRDFQVNEVDLQGNVARISTLYPPEAAAATQAQQAPHEPLAGEPLAAAACGIASAFAAIAGPRNGELLLHLVKAVAEATHPAAGAIGNADASADASAGAGSKPEDAVADGAPEGASDPLDKAGQEAQASGEGGGAADAAGAESDQAPCVEKLPGGGLQIVTEHISSKDVRRAVHEFLKGHAQLPRMISEAQLLGDEAGQEQKQKQEDRQIGIRVRWLPGDSGAAAGAGGRGGRGGRGGQKRSRDDPAGAPRRGWEGGRNQFTRFLLYKENMESQMAVGLLASNLRLAVGAFGYAGTKDKRGVTTQYMTVHKVEPWRLAGLNERLRGLRVGGPWTYCGQGLQLGALSGNEFRVLMRSVAAAPGEAQPGAAQAMGAGETAEGVVAEACRRVAKVGFINYFGLQRFGTGGAPTHKLGAALLRGEFDAAIRLIMTGRPGEKHEVAAARAAYLERNDARAALRLMPRWATAERAILEVLSKGQGASKKPNPDATDNSANSSASAAPAPADALSPAVLASSLRAIPRTLRMMYLHAYQSYLWNVAASHRVKEHGVERAVAGDLVLLSGDGSRAVDAMAVGGGAGDGGEGIEGGQDGGAAVSGGAEEASTDQVGSGAGAGAAGGGLASSKQRLAAVHVVTEEEALSGRFSINDVVLPLPGNMVQYPRHSTAAIYAQTARSDGISLAGEGLPASTSEGAGQEGREASVSGETGAGAAKLSGRDAQALKSLASEFSFASLTGDYRHVVLLPKGFDWKLARYSDPNDDSLATTDLEALPDEEQAVGQRDWDRRQAKRHKPRESENEAAVAGSSAPADSPEAQAATAVEKQGDTAGEKESSMDAPAAAPSVEGKAGPLLALSLRFQLPSSCYATMLIRELTKQSTHKDFQAGLSGAAAVADS